MHISAGLKCAENSVIFQNHRRSVGGRRGDEPGDSSGEASGIEDDQIGIVAGMAKANPELRAEDVERVVDVFFDEIAQRLADGGRVELRGFGAFSTREREARKGRNPRTGEAVDVPGKRSPSSSPARKCAHA
jgi:integration host factor subunit beta